MKNCKMFYQDMSIVCRICLTENINNESMYECIKGLSYKDTIKTFIGIDMVQADDLPCKICKECSTELQIVVKFVTKCKSSLEKLQSTLSHDLSLQRTLIIKEEEDMPLSIFCSKKEESGTVDVKDEILMESQIKVEYLDDDNYYDDHSEDDNKKTFKKEKKRKRTKRNSLQCDICFEIFESEEFVKIHKETHRGERPFICTHCNKTFRLKCTLREHIGRIHMRSQRESKKNCICHLCGKVCFRTNDLTLHLRTHTNEKPYKCSVCGQCFTQNNSLKVHMRYHTGERPYTCHICGKSFVSKSRLSYHMNVHNSEKNYECPICNKTVKTKKALRNHTLLHTDHKPNICEVCGAAFAQKVNLKTHIIAKHSKNSGTCEICKKSYSNLSEHNRVHTGEKPYTCNICGRGFPRQRHLTTHLRRHREAKKFACEHDKCDAAFPMQCQLDFHILKYHAKYYPFKCGCSKGFYRMADLNRHINATNCRTLTKETT